MFGTSSNKEQATSQEGTAIVRWREVGSKKCIHFTFKGVFTEQLAKDLVSQWQEMMKECKEEKVCIICECSEMKNYDSIARIKFQNCLKEFQKNIASFWIVTESKVAKYGGMLMGVLLSFPVKVVESEDKIIL
jgi:hypothetical protein